MKELIARVGVTLLFVGLVWSFVLPAMWPPSQLWIPVLLLVAAAGWAAGWLWLRYFEEQSVQRERRERAARLDRPAGRPEMARSEEVPRPAEVQERVWPPPPDQQSF